MSSDEYRWQFIFSAFFIALLGLCTWLLDVLSGESIGQLDFFEVVLLSLATFRVIRLVVYDKIAAFVRAPFFDTEKKDGEDVLIVPKDGPRRTIAQLLGCPWCFGVWAGFIVTFFYLVSSFFYFPILILAISGLATFIQLSANLVGWKAEGLKITAQNAAHKPAVSAPKTTKTPRKKSTTKKRS